MGLILEITNYKHQMTRKSQITNNKFQNLSLVFWWTNHKSQILNLSIAFCNVTVTLVCNFGHWYLLFICNLVLGIWDFYQPFMYLYSHTSMQFFFLSLDSCFLILVLVSAAHTGTVAGAVTGRVACWMAGGMTRGMAGIVTHILQKRTLIAGGRGAERWKTVLYRGELGRASFRNFMGPHGIIINSCRPCAGHRSGCGPPFTGYRPLEIQLLSIICPGGLEIRIPCFLFKPWSRGLKNLV